MEKRITRHDDPVKEYGLKIECKNKESWRISWFPWDWKSDDQIDEILRRLIVFLFVGIVIIEE